jgi:hypothetical protein
MVQAREDCAYHWHRAENNFVREIQSNSGTSNREHKKPGQLVKLLLLRVGTKVLDKTSATCYYCLYSMLAHPRI